MQIKLEAGVPHSYFTDTYASIKVQNSSGNILYNKEIIGNRQQAAESQTVPVKVGNYIEFTHIEGEAQKEKTRATLTNLENSKQKYIEKNISGYLYGIINKVIGFTTKLKLLIYILYKNLNYYTH